MASTASVTVDVKAKADTAALKQFQAELQQITKQGEMSAAQFQKLAAAGVDPFKKGALQGYIDDLGGVGNEAKKINNQFEFFKINQSKAVGEAQVLARELATGSFHARTLGSLLSALGPGITAAAIAAIVLFELIKNAVEQAAKLKEEIAKGSEELVKMAANWKRIVESGIGKGEEGVVGLTHSYTAAVEKLNEEITDLVRKSDAVTGFRRGLHELFAPQMGGPGLGALFGLDKPIAEMLTPESDKLLKIKRDQEQVQTRIIAKNIEESKTMQDLALTFPHTKAFLDTLIDSMGVYINAQNSANTETKAGQKAYAEATENLVNLQKVIEGVAAANKQLDDNTKKLNADVAQQVKAGNEQMELAFRQAEAQKLLDEALIPTREQQAAILDQMAALRTQQDGLNRGIKDENDLWLQLEAQLKTLDTAYNNLSGTINAITANMAKLNAEVEKQVKAGTTGLQDALDLNKKIEAEAAVRNAQGNEELQITEKVNLEKLKTRQMYEAINERAGTTVVTEDEIAKHVEMAGESERHRLEVIAGTGTAQSGLNAAMKDYETILQGIRQQQKLISENPFMGVDAKDAALLRLYREELEKVKQAILDASAKRATLVDPNEIARADQEIQKLTFHAQDLRLKITGLTAPLRTELTSWANSFGSTAHQVANTIEQTIGASLQAVNQFLVTGKFNAQALLQQIVMLGLQLVEQMIIQRVMAAINAAAAAGQAAATGPIVAASWGPAATAATIATQGAAAAQAPFAIAAALAASMGILVAHEGGSISRRRRMHSGGLAADEVPIIAQEGEIMIQRSVAQREGMAEFLLGLNAGEFHGGGEIMLMHNGGEFDRDWLPPGEFWGPMTPPWEEPPPLPSPPPNPFGQPDPNVFINRLPPDFDFAGDTRQSLWLSRMWAGFGTTPSTGLPAFGPTQIQTNWVNYPGVGLVPMAVPVTPDIPHVAQARHTPWKAESHRGGVISRFHSGGSVGGSGGGGGIHIYAFTDLKALTRHMAGKEGQKIIFDTVKGRRIDLGIK